MYYQGRKGNYELGDKIKKGGEGTVYNIKGQSKIVAKIYSDTKLHSTIQNTSARVYLKEKINTMLDQPINPYMDSGHNDKQLFVAWPSDILFDHQGQFVGYVMPKVKGKSISYACVESVREKMFPHYTWRVATKIAYNLASAIYMIHSQGIVVGDLNSNNILIDNNGFVTLIDTDSFNIKNNRTNKVYKCCVGVPELLAPELQGKDLSKESSVFNFKTDDFALAIHIFNLMMNNCHPFSYIGMNTLHSSSSYNQTVMNIIRGQCPYVSGSKEKGVKDAPNVEMLPYQIRVLFDRAFQYNQRNCTSSIVINNRPSSLEWMKELGRVAFTKMNTCHKNSHHVYPSHYHCCPWCEIEKRKKKAVKGKKKPIQVSIIDKMKEMQTIPYRIQKYFLKKSKEIRLTIIPHTYPIWITNMMTAILSAFLYSYSEEGKITISLLNIILALIIGYFVSILKQTNYRRSHRRWLEFIINISLTTVGTFVFIAIFPTLLSMLLDLAIFVFALGILMLFL